MEKQEEVPKKKPVPSEDFELENLHNSEVFELRTNTFELEDAICNYSNVMNARKKQPSQTDSDHRLTIQNFLCQKGSDKLTKKLELDCGGSKLIIKDEYQLVFKDKDQIEEKNQAEVQEVKQNSDLETMRISQTCNPLSIPVLKERKRTPPKRNSSRVIKNIVNAFIRFLQDAKFSNQKLMTEIQSESRFNEALIVRRVLGNFQEKVQVFGFLIKTQHSQCRTKSWQYSQY